MPLGSKLLGRKHRSSARIVIPRNRLIVSERARITKMDYIRAVEIANPRGIESSSNSVRQIAARLRQTPSDAARNATDLKRLLKSFTKTVHPLTDFIPTASNVIARNKASFGVLNRRKNAERFECARNIGLRKMSIMRCCGTTTGLVESVSKLSKSWERRLKSTTITRRGGIADCFVETIICCSVSRETIQSHLRRKQFFRIFTSPITLAPAPSLSRALTWRGAISVQSADAVQCRDYAGLSASMYVRPRTVIFGWGGPITRPGGSSPPPPARAIGENLLFAVQLTRDVFVDISFQTGGGDMRAPIRSSCDRPCANTEEPIGSRMGGQVSAVGSQLCQEFRMTAYQSRRHETKISLKSGLHGFSRRPCGSPRTQGNDSRVHRHEPSRVRRSAQSS